MLQLVRVMSDPKEYKIVANENLNQKFSTLARFQNKIFTTCQISDHFFTTRQILKQIFRNMSDFVLKKVLKIKILQKNVHSENLVLTEFAP